MTTSRPVPTFARAVAALLFAAALLAAPRARAGGEGKAFFDSGVRHYNLGHFQDAITDFEKAYNIDPVPILLFNIAQSHRQLGDKERALFFYRRYLEQAPNPPNKGEVEQRMKDLTQSLQQEHDLKQKPPPGVETGDHPPPPPPPPTKPNNDVPIMEDHATPAEGAHPWLAEAYLAPSFVGFSGRAVDAPVMIAVRAGGSYAIPFGASSLRVGADVLAAVLPYTDTMKGTKQSSSLWGFMLTARYLYEVAPAFTLGGGVGAGVIWWGGLAQNNPFTVGGVSADAPIPMPSFQLGLRAEYAFGSHMFVAVSPEFLLSKTTSDGLSKAISSVHRLDIYAGAGYRF